MALSLQDKAQFYQKLAAGLKAGLTLPQIIDAQLLPATMASRNVILKQQVDKGAAFSKAFQQAGLVSNWEARLIHVGEASGTLESVFARLDNFFCGKVLQLSHIKSKLVYPMLTVLVALVVLPLPAVFASVMTVTGYGFQVLVGVAILVLLYRTLILKPFANATMGAFNPLLLKSLRFVSDSHFLRLQFEVAYMDLLTLCLASGMDAVQSMKLLQDNFSQRTMKKRHAFAISKVEKGGSSLSDALGGQDILRHPQVLSFLAASEASGTMHSELREFLVRKRQEVEETTDYWIRRVGAVVYVATAGYAVLKIVPLFMSTLIP